MIRYISSLFISIAIYIGLIYSCLYFSNRIKHINIEPKRETRIKISLLEPQKSTLKPKPTPTPIILPPKPKPKLKKIVHKVKEVTYKSKKVAIYKFKKNNYKTKKITHKIKKNSYKIKKITHKVKKNNYKIKKTTHKSKVVEEIYTQQPIIYTPQPKPIIEEEIYSEPKIITPIPQKIKRVVKRDMVDTTPIKYKKRRDDLTIQKRKFLKRVRESIYLNRRYPSKAKKRGIEGSVHLVFDITSSGEAVNIRTSNAPKILQKSVKKALKQSFPIEIPSILVDKFPMRNISINIEFKLE